jgi:hypothetical protein
MGASFKQYLIDSEKSYQTEIKQTLKKLPKRHAALLKGYKFKFQGTNTLKGDNDHVGIINQEKETVTIASPWNYGREYTLLHEIGHFVYQTLLSGEAKKKWARIVKNTKMKKEDRQVPEELFCMAYANHYAKHKHVMFSHPSWEKFIAKLPN